MIDPPSVPKFGKSPPAALLSPATTAANFGAGIVRFHRSPPTNMMPKRYGQVSARRVRRIHDQSIFVELRDVSSPDAISTVVQAGEFGTVTVATIAPSHSSETVKPFV